jgi:hypothetical protein
MGIRIRIRKKNNIIHNKTEEITDTKHEDLIKRLEEKIKWIEEKKENQKKKI